MFSRRLKSNIFPCLYCIPLIILLTGCGAVYQASTNLNNGASIIGFDERALIYLAYYNQYSKNQLQDIDIDKLRNSYRYTPWFSLSLTPAQSLLWAKLHQYSATYEIDKCIEVIEQHIAHYFVDLYLHNYASFCYSRNNQLDLAEIHTHITTNLLYSILATGDGLTMDTAFQVVNSAEIISFLQLTDIELVDLKVVDKLSEAAAQSAENAENAENLSKTDSVTFFFKANAIERATQEKIAVWFTLQRPTAT